MSKVRRIEAGAILPIAAVLIVPLMILFLLFGLDTFRIKRADLELRAVADKVCQAAVKNLPFQNRVAEEFLGQLTAARNGGGDLLPQLGSFDRIDATLILAATVNDLTPGTGSRPACPTSLGLADASPTNLSCGDDCEVTVIDDYCDTQGSPRDLPINFSDPWSAQGTFLGCKLQGRIRSFLPAGLYSLAGLDPSEERTASVRYAYGQRIRDFSPPSTPDSSPWGASPGDSGPAFVLAIAPQLMTADQTDVLLPLMRFERVGDVIAEGSPLQGAFRTLARQYDPLRGGTVASRYDVDQPNSPADGVLDFPNGAASSWSFSDNTSPVLTQNFDIPDSDTRERLVANCMNPVILLRNALASALVEMAGRSGHFRNRSEVLLVNSESVHPPSSPDPGRGPTRFPPTIMVPFNQDLLAPGDDGTNPFSGYQLPFTPSFWSGTRGVPRASIGGYRSAWVNPLIAAAALSGDQQQLTTHRILASQMRICSLMYYGGTAPNSQGPGMTLRPLHDSSDSSSITNVGFDANFEEKTGPSDPPIDYEGGIDSSVSIARPAHLRGDGGPYSNPGPNNERWEQECPWSGLGGSFVPSSTCPSPPGRRARGLTASELVASLGSVQTCPVSTLSMEDGNPCTYAGLNTNNVDFPLASPDLLGLQAYLSGNPDFPAIRSPGIFPFRKDDDSREFGVPSSVSSGPVEVKAIYPRDARQTPSYGARKNLVLILHRPPSNTSCDPGNWRDGYRSVTVIYIPAPSPAEFLAGIADPTSPAAINQVRSCFGLDAATNPYFSEDGKVMLLVLSPNEPRYDPDARDDEYESLPDFSELDEEERFATYWAYLLTGEPTSVGGSPESSESIIDVAAAIYNQRLVETVPHL